MTLPDVGGHRMNADQLRAIPLFEGLSSKEREQIARWADEVDVPAGKHLVDQGRFAYEFFVIEEGTAEVRQDRHPIAALGPGDVLGEIGLLEGSLRSATIETLTPVRAIVMDARSFASMMGAVPKVAERIRAIERQRLGDD
jgi:CRP/FNR family transcriptional regulator, cyclic AMP receptor protein